VELTTEAVKNICVWDLFGVWGQEIEDGIKEQLERSGLAVDRECVRIDGEEGRVLLATPVGKPAGIFQPRFVVSESDNTIVVQIGSWVGSGSGPCGRFPNYPCVFECTFERIDGGWGEPSCEIAAFSVSGPQGLKGAQQPACRTVGFASWPSR